MYKIIKRLKKRNPVKPKKPYNNIKEGMKIEGVYRFYSIIDNKKKLIEEKHNLIMDDVHHRVANAFIGGFDVGIYYDIKHLAIGTGTTAVTGTDTTLDTEVYRVPYVVQANPSQKVITVDFYITDSEYVGDIEEIGIFGGYESTISANSGNLLSRVLWSYTKSSGEEILIEYQLTIS